MSPSFNKLATQQPIAGRVNTPKFLGVFDQGSQRMHESAFVLAGFSVLVLSLVVWGAK